MKTTRQQRDKARELLCCGAGCDEDVELVAEFLAQQLEGDEFQRMAEKALCDLRAQLALDTALSEFEHRKCDCGLPQGNHRC